MLKEEYLKLELFWLVYWDVDCHLSLRLWLLVYLGFGFSFISEKVLLKISVLIILYHFLVCLIKTHNMKYKNFVC